MQAQPQPTSRAPRDPKTQHAATGQNAAAFRLGPGPPVADPEYLAAAKAFPNLWSPLKANRIVAVDECFGQNRTPTSLLGNPVRGRYRSAAQWFPRSEEHTTELQSLMRTSYAVFCLKQTTQKKKNTNTETN